MPDPFDMPPEAFDPFYRKCVAFLAHRADGNHRGTVCACIFDEGYADIIDSETSTSSRIARIVFHVRRADWSKAMLSPPQAGDRFTSPDSGKTYALVSADHFSGDVWTLEAREVSS